jgi:broad specificity phosphatase PhoE
VIVEENLHELDHGALEGLTFAEIHSVHTDFIRDWRERPAEALVPAASRSPPSSAAPGRRFSVSSRATATTRRLSS